MATKTEIFRIIENLTEEEQEKALEFIRNLANNKNKDEKRIKLIKSIRGKYKHVLTSSEDFAKRKEAEKELEH